MAAATTPVIRLKGNAFAEPDYFRTDVTKGVTRTPSGTRICTLPSDFLLGFRDAVIYECGRSYRGVMKAAGKRWGGQFIKRLERELTGLYQTPFKDLPTGVSRVALADAFNYHGYGKLQVESLEIDDAWTLVDIANPVMPSLVRESERPVDMLTAGMLGAIFSQIQGRSLDCVQTECPSLGADRSRFLIGSAVRVAEIEQWIEDADPMPSHDEIIDKIFHANSTAETHPEVAVLVS